MFSRLTALFLRLAHFFLPSAADTLAIINHSEKPVIVVSPSAVINPGSSWHGNTVDELVFHEPQVRLEIPQGAYAVAVVKAGVEVDVYDANDMQVELSRASLECNEDVHFYGCLARTVFSGGLGTKFMSRAFNKLWQSRAFWGLCNLVEPVKAVRSETVAGEAVEIIRESPLVAAVRGFASAESCVSLMDVAGLKSLSPAHVGQDGFTQTSDSRETLTRNIFVDWNVENAVTLTAVRMFDLSSELLGQKLSYEGQEPINFLHYLKGFEYRPHTDGGYYSRGKRVATTLLYCETAVEGGGTAFSSHPSFRFQPQMGDLLFFEYEPSPRAAEHAACPVIRGNKSTFTQWHRRDVSFDAHWDKFENWGEFFNPHGKSRWAGVRHAKVTRADL